MVKKLTPPPPVVPTGKAPASPAGEARAKKPAKSFSVKVWDDTGQGEKILLYGASGMGKTTLASMAPNPVFLGLDDGGRKLRHPKTGERLKFIPVEDFYDVRAVLQNPEIIADYDTIVIDQITELESWAEKWVFENRTGPKGKKCTDLVQYGFNKGWQHLYDAMKLILTDADNMVKAGKNVLFIAQAAPHKVANPGGEDYLRDGPRLYSGNPSIESVYCEWADHILRIDYYSMMVEERKASAGNERAVFIQPQAYFRAKSRTLKEGVVWFKTVDDDSIWSFMFNDS